MVGVQIVGQDIRLEFRIDIRRARRPSRRWRLKSLRNICRNGIPNRAFSGGLYVVQGIVDHAVGQVTHFIPVLGIQGFVSVSIHQFGLISTHMVRHRLTR